MNLKRQGMVLAVKEHLTQGNPITQLEAITLFGVPSLTKIISDMRRGGWVIKSRLIPFAAAVTRVNKYASLQPPNSLPVREIQITEYWVNK